jgi:hypothetical protein
MSVVVKKGEGTKGADFAAPHANTAQAKCRFYLPKFDNPFVRFILKMWTRDRRKTKVINGQHQVMPLLGTTERLVFLTPRLQTTLNHSGDRFGKSDLRIIIV